MRPTYLLFIFLLILLPGIKGQKVSNRDDFFRVFIDGGPAIQKTKTGGGVLEVNAVYLVNDRFQPGLQFAFAGFDEHQESSTIVTIDYYFLKTHQFQFSAGAGYGLYNNSYYTRASGSEINEHFSSTGKTGGMLRMGMEWKHLCFKMAYHFAPTLYKYYADGYGTLPSVIFPLQGSYFGITLGVRIGRAGMQP